MGDWTTPRGFERDAGNARKNEDAHDVSQAEAEQVFLNAPLVLIADEKHSDVEDRFHALGVTNAERRLHVTFTLRGERGLIRVISVRDMSRKEGRIYEEAS